MKSTSESLEIIKKKISKLRELDQNFTIFGSEEHKYELGEHISIKQIEKFEQDHKIILPSDYREFILEFGDGCCGPNYGLMKLDSGILDIPQYPEESEVINLSNKFRFSSAWNLEFLQGGNEVEWEKLYEDVKWCDGMLRISHEGCGCFTNIIVKGVEQGNIWIDNRASDDGIYPVDYKKGIVKTTFFEWYMNWLESSLKTLL